MRNRHVFTGIFCVFLNCFAPLAAADELIFAVDIIRHGDRTPVKEIPKAPGVWHQVLGELTPEGMYQEYSLGKAKAEQYKMENHLLPNTYDRKSLLVRSTDFDRTLMSAEAFLLGLYPPSAAPSGQFSLPYHYQPIPIHTVALNEENLLISKLERTPAMSAKYVYSSKMYQDRIAQLKTKLSLWQTQSGMDMTNINNLIFLGDNLFVRKLHHVPLPAGISDREADEIIHAGEWFSISKYAPFGIGMNVSHELLTTITKNFNDASRETIPLKYILYSGHDDTLLSMLSALHNPQQTRPRYASDLNFLLFKNSKNDFYVKVIFNGKPLMIPGCEKRCTLADFNKLSANVKQLH